MGIKSYSDSISLLRSLPVMGNAATVRSLIAGVDLRRRKGLGGILLIDGPKYLVAFLLCAFAVVLLSYHDASRVQMMHHGSSSVPTISEAAPPTGSRLGTMDDSKSLTAPQQAPGHKTVAPLLPRNAFRNNEWDHNTKQSPEATDSAREYIFLNPEIRGENLSAEAIAYAPIKLPQFIETPSFNRHSVWVYSTVLSSAPSGVTLSPSDLSIGIGYRISERVRIGLEGGRNVYSQRHTTVSTVIVDSIVEHGGTQDPVKIGHIVTTESNVDLQLLWGAIQIRFEPIVLSWAEIFVLFNLGATSKSVISKEAAGISLPVGNSLKVEVTAEAIHQYFQPTIQNRLHVSAGLSYGW